MSYAMLQTEIAAWRGFPYITVCFSCLLLLWIICTCRSVRTPRLAKNVSPMLEVGTSIEEKVARKDSLNTSEPEHACLCVHQLGCFNRELLQSRASFSSQ